jgi:hypothetical protein
VSPTRPKEDLPVRLTAALVCVPLLLSGCSSSPDEPPRPELPDESDFAQGTCQEAAPDLLELGRALQRLGDGGSVPPDVQQVLADVQDRLSLFAEAAEPGLAPALPTLVERIGGVRIRAVGNTYEASLGEDLQTAYDEVLAVCTR